MSRERRRRGVERERAARAARAARPPAPSPLDWRPASTEAATALATDLDAAGLPELATAARKLEYDVNWSPRPDPLTTLFAELHAAGTDAALAVVAAMKTGAYDPTDADEAVYASSARGRADKALADRAWNAMPGLRDQFLTGLDRLDGDPAAMDTLVKGYEAAVLAAVGLTEPAPDDDMVIDPADVPPPLRAVLGTVGPQGQRLDTPEILAAGWLVAGSGGQGYALGPVDPDDHGDAAAWFAEAQFGRVIRRKQGPGPNAAARALADLVLTGGRCRCGKVATTDPDGFYAQNKTLADGTVWTVEEQKAAGSCLWRRHGLRWTGACGGTVNYTGPDD